MFCRTLETSTDFGFYWFHSTSSTKRHLYTFFCLCPKDSVHSWFNQRYSMCSSAVVPTTVFYWFNRFISSFSGLKDDMLFSTFAIKSSIDARTWNIQVSTPTDRKLKGSTDSRTWTRENRHSEGSTDYRSNSFYRFYVQQRWLFLPDGHLDELFYHFILKVLFLAVGSTVCPQSPLVFQSQTLCGFLLCLSGVCWVLGFLHFDWTIITLCWSYFCSSSLVYI